MQQELTEDINLEICVCNDASEDDTILLISKWLDIFKKKNIILKIYNNESGEPGGGVLMTPLIY